MAEQAAPRTLLEKIVRESDRTIEEWCARFDSLARELGENTTLSARQLQRWMAGETDNARPAARRVAARLWGFPFPQLQGAPQAAPAGAEVGPYPARENDQPDPESVEALEVVAIMAAHESTRHASQAGGGVSPSSVEQIQAEVWRLARRYAAMPPLLLLAEARRARNLTYATLDRTRRPAQTADLYLAAGQLCGLMSVASFDLASWDAAAEQARAAHVYAELVDNPGLRTWARGTQALIDYWTGRPRQALVHIEAGLDGAPAGAAQARLRCIDARARSQLGGDPRHTIDALAQADNAQAATSNDDLHDEIGGEFSWGPAQHAACASTALLAIGDPRGAADRAREALALLGEDGAVGLVRERAHIDLAAADLALQDLDSTRAALEPVWVVPIAHRRHGLTDRLADIARTLRGPTWKQVPVASELRDQIEVFNTEAQGRALPSA